MPLPQARSCKVLKQIRVFGELQWLSAAPTDSLPSNPSVWQLIGRLDSQTHQQALWLYNTSSCCSLALNRGSLEQRGWTTDKEIESNEQMFHAKYKRFISQENTFNKCFTWGFFTWLVRQKMLKLNACTINGKLSREQFTILHI